MINKKPLKSFYTATIVALSLSINSLYSITQATPLLKNTPNPVTQTRQMASHHHAKNKATGGISEHRMRMDETGMVMYENINNIPKDCPKITEEITLRVKAGVKFAEKYPGTVFGFDSHQWQVKPCSRITVEFTNEDNIRHQWMIHGLPTYLYPKGMFHLELNGPGTIKGSFILPSSHYTYLVHCDISQHMEKGMKAQLKAGKGRGDLPSIPGISNPTFAD